MLRETHGRQNGARRLGTLSGKNTNGTVWTFLQPAMDGLFPNLNCAMDGHIFVPRRLRRRISGAQAAGGECNLTSNAQRTHPCSACMTGPKCEWTAGHAELLGSKKRAAQGRSPLDGQTYSPCGWVTQCE